jgi:hypothetical protein
MASDIQSEEQVAKESVKAETPEMEEPDRKLKNGEKSQEMPKDRHVEVRMPAMKPKETVVPPAVAPRRRAPTGSERIEGDCVKVPRVSSKANVTQTTATKTKVVRRSTVSRDRVVSPRDTQPNTPAAKSIRDVRRLVESKESTDIADLEEFDEQDEQGDEEQAKDESEEEEEEEEDEDEPSESEEEEEDKEKEVEKEEKEEQQDQDEQKKLELAVENARDYVDNLIDQVEASRGEQTKLLGRRAELNRKVSLHVEALKRLEVDQVASSEAEEFERAHQLGEQMAAMRGKVERERLNLVGTSEAWRSLLDRRRSLRERVATAHRDHARKLRALHAHLSADVGARVLSLEQEHEAEHARLELECADVARQTEAATVDLKVLGENEALIRDAIREQTKKLRDEGDTYGAERDRLADEIARLREQLRAKEAEYEGHRNAIEALDKQIDDVQQRYAQDLQRIGAKKKASLKSLRATDRRHKQALAERRALEARRIKVPPRVAELRVRAQRVEAQIGDADASALAVDVASDQQRDAENLRRDAIEHDIACHSSVAKLRASLREAETAAATLSADVLELEQQSASVESAIERADASIPKLEAKKSVAARSRKFKEAAAIARQLKEQQLAVAAQRVELAECVERLESARAELKRRSSEHAELAEQLADAELRADTDKLDILRCHRHKLTQSLKLAIAADKFDDAEHLQIELDATQAEITQICRFHQIDDQVDNEEEEEEEEEESDQDEQDEVENEAESSGHEEQDEQQDNDIEEDSEGDSEKEDSEEDDSEKEDSEDDDDLQSIVDEKEAEIEALDASIVELAEQELFEEADAAQSKLDELHEQVAELKAKLDNDN